MGLSLTAQRRSGVPYLINTFPGTVYNSKPAGRDFFAGPSCNFLRRTHEKKKESKGQKGPSLMKRNHGIRQHATTVVSTEKERELES